MVVEAAVVPGSVKLDRLEGIGRGMDDVVPALAVVLADMGIGFTGVAPARCFESEACPTPTLEPIDPAEDTVEVIGIDEPPLGPRARATASDSDAGEPLRPNDSIVAVDDVLGEVTRDSGADDGLKSDADEDEELGRETPLKLPSDADAMDADVLGRFFADAPVRAPTLLEDASSGTSGIPADLSCGYADNCENHGSSSSTTAVSEDPVRA